MKKEAISWTLLSSKSGISARFIPNNCLFDNNGSSAFPIKDKEYLLGFLNSLVANSCLTILNPTLAFQVGNIASLPYKDLKDKCRIIIMGGSIYKGYINQTAPCAEYNIQVLPKAFQTVLNSGFEIILAPLDVCRDFIIEGRHFAALKDSSNTVINIVLDYYQEWHKNYQGGAIKYDQKISSGILYDILPILYLIDPDNFIESDKKIICTKAGYTKLRFYGKKVKALLGLKDKEKAISHVTDIFLRKD